MLGMNCGDDGQDELEGEEESWPNIRRPPPPRGGETGCLVMSPSSAHWYSASICLLVACACSLLVIVGAMECIPSHARL
jgi:hypothetical protein